MADLFGFRFSRIKDDKNKENFTLPSEQDGTIDVAGGGFFGQVLDTDGRERTESDLIRRYRDIAQQPECDSAIEDIVNEGIVANERAQAIATASKFQLFEFNDEFTRAQFRNLVEPFLRDVQGRRGISDFSVVADGTNNTGEVIDRNEFVADIFVKPARSINFITLSFIATRTGVNFSEVGG